LVRKFVKGGGEPNCSGASSLERSDGMKYSRRSFMRTSSAALGSLAVGMKPTQDYAAEVTGSAQDIILSEGKVSR
jgi:hypothetical protein